jgi:polyhydroxybutyrate depolymerase
VIPSPENVNGVRYANSASDAELVFYTIAGGGHAWPGGKPLPKFIVGHTPTEIDATRTMWAFFQEHPLPGKK